MHYKVFMVKKSLLQVKFYRGGGENELHKFEKRWIKNKE